MYQTKHLRCEKCCILYKLQSGGDESTVVQSELLDRVESERYGAFCFHGAPPIIDVVDQVGRRGTPVVTASKSPKPPRIQTLARASAIINVIAAVPDKKEEALFQFRCNSRKNIIMPGEILGQGLAAPKEHRIRGKTHYLAGLGLKFDFQRFIGRGETGQTHQILRIVGLAVFRLHQIAAQVMIDGG